MYAGRVACCLLLSHDEYADGTERGDGQPPDRYITLSAMDAASVKTDWNFGLSMFTRIRRRLIESM